MRPLLAAGLLALFAGWCGTFYYGASAAAVVVAHVVLIGLAAWGWRGWDPLRLGAVARGLPALLWTLMLLSLRTSTVPRAGWVAVALLPALLALPAAIARSLALPAHRRLGVLAIAGVGGMIGAVALVAMAWQRSSRAAQPLGQTLVLAEVLAPLLPLAVIAVDIASTARRAGRWLATGSVVLIAAALLATRSFGATAGATLGLLLVLPRGRRRWALAVLLLGCALLAPRMLRVAHGLDSSVLARRTYFEAGLLGLREHPLLGFGPGATPWTLPPLIRPIPGENPPGEVVTDLHALPLQLAFELGLPAVLLAAALLWVFVRARKREAAATAEAELAALGRAGVAGVAAGLVTLLVGPTLGTLAPWVALGIAAGVALVPRRETASAALLPTATEPAPRLAARAGALYAAVALLLLLPLDAAHVCYDVARRSQPTRARAMLRLAVQLDPEEPLYHARLGWLATSAPARTLEIERAAAGAPGVAALQLAAGWAATASGNPAAARWLRRACTSDPLSGVAPFLLALREPSPDVASRLAGRALLNDPPLLAAVDWEERPDLERGALHAAQTWPGVDAGFREAILWTAKVLPRGGPVGTLRVTADDQLATSMSLYAFRRLPWPATLATVLVRADAARHVALAPASSLRTSTRSAFPADCAAAPPPGRE